MTSKHFFLVASVGQILRGDLGEDHIAAVEHTTGIQYIFFCLFFYFEDAPEDVGGRRVDR